MSTSIGDLALKIGVNSVDFSAGLKAAAADLTTFTQRGKDDVSSLATGFNLLKDAATGVYSSLGKQNEEVKKQSDMWSKIEDTIIDVVAGFLLAQVPLLSLAATTEKVGEATKSWGGDLDQITGKLYGIAAFSRTLGDSSDNAQVTLRAFARGGLGEDDARATSQRFFQRMGLARDAVDNFQPNTTAGAIRQLGLDPRALTEMNSSAAIRTVITSLGQLDDVYKRDSVSMEIFGKSYMALEDLIRRSGPIFDEAAKDVAAFGHRGDVIKMAEETKNAWRSVSDNWEQDVTGPIGAAWQRLYANLDSWNASFFKSLTDGLHAFRTLSTREDSAESVQSSIAALRESGLSEEDLRRVASSMGPEYRRAILGADDATLSRAATRRTDGTPVHPPGSRFDRMGNLLPNDDAYHIITDGLLPQRNGESFREQYERTWREIQAAGAHIRTVDAQGRLQGPATQAEQLARLMQLRPDLGQPDRDEQSQRTVEAGQSLLQMQTSTNDLREQLRNFGADPNLVRHEAMLGQVQLNGSPEQIRAAEADTQEFKRHTEELQKATSAMALYRRGADLLGEAFQTMRGPAGNAIASFNADLATGRNAPSEADPELVQRMVATHAFLRLESSLGPGTIPNVANGVRADSAEAVRVVENARRAATSQDPQRRVEDVLRRANDQRTEQTRVIQALADAIERNGLAVAGIP